MSKELLELLQRIQVRRIEEEYGKSPKKALYRILHEIETMKHYGARHNWEIMVELLAHHLGITKTQHEDVLRRVNDLNLLESYCLAVKKNPWDYIGDVYMETELTGPGENMTPKPIINLMIQMTYGEKFGEKCEAKLFCYFSYHEYIVWYYLTHHAPPNHLRPMEFPFKTQLDPCVGSGRFLIEASLMYPKAPLILFGVEINLWLYRACLVNMKLLSNHPYSIVCADALRLDPNKSGPASRLWDHGNYWDPPDVTDFYWKPTPPFQEYLRMQSKDK